MAKNNDKKHFYVGKGSQDPHPYMYYGTQPPIFSNNRICSTDFCKFIGSFQENPIANSIEDDTIVKIYIRKEKK